jgi:hypothetical protein
MAANPIHRGLVDVEVSQASASMYLIATRLETIAEYGPPGVKGALRRRATELRTAADSLTEGVADAFKTP